MEEIVQVSEIEDLSIIYNHYHGNIPPPEKRISKTVSAGVAAAVAEDDDGADAALAPDDVPQPRPHRSLLVSLTRNSMGPCAKMHLPFFRMGQVAPP
jgi:hypothetical protein